MITTTLSNLPTPPQSTDPANFITRADAFVTALDAFQPEMNSVISEINTTATDVNADAASASESAIAATGAANYRGDWVAGTYSLGQSVSYNGYRYASKINGNTDAPPSANWLPIGVGGEVYSAAAKTAPVDADVFGFLDSAASFVLKKLTWANLKSALGLAIASKQNILINPHFNINQRAYVSGTATTIANQYTFDRWRIPTLGESITYSVSSGVTTITLPASGLEQIIEPQFIQGGSYVLTVNGTASVITVSQSVDNVTYNAVTPSGGVYTITANYYVKINLKSGDVTSIKFEEGTVASPIARTDDTFRAKRYYETGANITQRLWAGSAASSYFAGSFRFSNQMRATPTVTTSTPTYVNSSALTASATTRDLQFTATTTTGGQVYSVAYTWFADSEIY